MNIFFEIKALKELKKLQQECKEIILNKIKELKKYPNIEDLNTKKLKTPFKWYRLRIWNYRVLFVVNNKIIIYSINHRKDVYK